MSTLALSKSPNCNRRAMFWHQIITTLLRQQELLYSFINSLLPASPLGWAWYTSGLELIWVQEMEGKYWHSFLFVLQGCFFPFRRKWCDQNNVLSSISNPKDQSWTLSENHKEQQKISRSGITKCNTQESVFPDLGDWKEVTMQLGGLQMKSLFS